MDGRPLGIATEFELGLGRTTLGAARQCLSVLQWLLELNGRWLRQKKFFMDTFFHHSELFADSNRVIS
jgi:hypothetical protein